MPKIRTQVQLDRAHYARLKALAFRRGQSMSAVLRALLDEALGVGGAPRGEVRAAREGFVGSGRDRRTDVARNHDRYLYGERP